MYLPYTEIFAQILDNSPIILTNLRIKQKQIIESQLGLSPTEYNADQLSLYTGIPSVSHRWAALKLGFYHKLHHLNNKSVMHEWAKLPNIRHYSLFNQYMNLRAKWLPPQHELINDEWIWIDPFTHYKKVAKIRPMIIAKQHSETMSYVDKFYPLRIMNHLRGDYRAYDMFDAEELCDYVRDKMVNQYRKLFYQFDNSDRYCKWCRSYSCWY